ncbi:MAG: FecR domain-containing protein [Candidatus Delongbacteria bacterium]|nr:FecR domain-containing protein [Candidatus Delongbacteria bacterium]MBN2833774.1 FecR domain-containing protein [Candidatus Delongbacteria bacterium]
MKKLVLMILIFVFFIGAEEKGKVTLVDGVVKKKFVDAVDFDEDVKKDGVVQSRESYKTMLKSRAELELKGMDIIRLAPKTTIDLIALYEEMMEGNNESTVVKLNEGDIWAQVNSSDDNSEFNIETDIAAAAITGTNFSLSKKDGETTLKVYHGEVKISNSENPDKVKESSVFDPIPKIVQPTEVSGPTIIDGPKEVTLTEWLYIVKNMQKITFDNKGNVLQTGEFSNDDEEEKGEWVQWNKKADRARGWK